MRVHSKIDFYIIPLMLYYLGHLVFEEIIFLGEDFFLATALRLSCLVQSCGFVFGLCRLMANAV